VGQRGLQGDPSGDEVVLERRAEHVQRQLGRVGAGLLARQRAARDRDDVAQGPAVRGRRFERRRHGVGVGRVHDELAHAAAAARDAVEREHAVAPRHQGVDDGAADPAGRTRDQDVGHVPRDASIAVRCCRNERAFRRR
jgi:hypothetical protein